MRRIGAALIIFLLGFYFGSGLGRRTDAHTERRGETVTGHFVGHDEKMRVHYSLTHSDPATAKIANELLRGFLGYLSHTLNMAGEQDRRSAFYNMAAGLLEVSQKNKRAILNRDP